MGFVFVFNKGKDNSFQNLVTNSVAKQKLKNMYLSWKVSIS